MRESFHTPAEIQEAPLLIEVEARKHDQSKHRQWQAQLVRQVGSLLILDARFDAEISHELLGVIASGTRSIEYYWLDRWYNVFRFLEPDGALRNFYCNINLPPTFDGHLLSYVDLDIDLLVAPDLTYRIVDLEEFEENAIKFNYSLDLKNHAERALCELVSLIEQREFPFNQSL